MKVDRFEPELLNFVVKVDGFVRELSTCPEIVPQPIEKDYKVKIFSLLETCEDLRGALRKKYFSEIPKKSE